MFKSLDTEIENYEETFEYVKSRVDVLIEEVNKRLPTRIDLSNISKYGSLYPYKLQVIKASQLYRNHELASSILMAFNSQNYTAAAILVRSFLESSALLFYIGKKINRTIESNSTGDIDSILMSALMGYSDGKKEKSKAKPIQVLTAVDHAEKRVPGYRREYDHLSNYTHPNWFGSHNMYAKIKDGEYITEFDASLNNSKSSWNLVYPPLFLSLVLLIHSCDWIDKLTPELTIMCDRNSPNHPSG